MSIEHSSAHAATPNNRKAFEVRPVTSESWLHSSVVRSHGGAGAMSLLPSIPIVGVFLVTMLFSVHARAYEQHKTVAVTGGLITGFDDGEVTNFNGIPFADSPGKKENRFKGPRDVLPWKTPMIAQVPKPACQTSFDGGDDSQSGKSEDCLYLNVATPKNHSPLSRHPVMVWIHGAGWETGSGNKDYSAVVEHGDVTVVSVNYRNGVYGFTWLDALNKTENTEDSSESDAHPFHGNYALRDVRKALQWVQANIASFGGNPNNVTVFGQSAGGHFMCSMLGSPAFKGLFHKTIMQSGACTATTQQQALTYNQTFLENVGCDLTTNGSEQERNEAVRKCFEDLTPEEIRRAVGKSGQAGLVSFEPSLVIDGNEDPESTDFLIPAHPLLMIENNHYNDVPVIIGGTKNEVPGPLFARAALKPVWHEAVDWLFFGKGDKGLEHAEMVRSHYGLENYGNYMAATYHLHNDLVYRCPNLRVAEALAKNGHEDVYLYEFDYPIDLIPSVHGMDMVALFWGDTLPFSLVPGMREVQENILNRWTRFARKGNPNSNCVGWFCEAKWHTFDETVPVYDFGNLVEHHDLDYSGCMVLDSTRLVDPIEILERRDLQSHISSAK